MPKRFSFPRFLLRNAQNVGSLIPQLSSSFVLLDSFGKSKIDARPGKLTRKRSRVSGKKSLVTRTQERRNTRCSLDRWIKSPSREWNIILGACQLSLGCSVRFLPFSSLSLSLSFRFSKHRRFQYLFARGVRRELLQLSSVLQRIIFFELSAVKINAFVVDSLHILTVRARHLLAF